MSEPTALEVRLKELGLNDEMIGKVQIFGATEVGDLVHLKESDLTGFGLNTIQARKFIVAVAPAPAAVLGGLRVPAAVTSVRLQEPPTSQSWLSSLCAIRPQVIQPVTVLTGIKAAMADNFGYFQLPRKMMHMLRSASDAVGEGVPDLFFDLQNLTQARRYGALVSWMQGKGSACTIAERNRFLQRMQEKFWDVLDAFHNELDSWRQGRRTSADVGEQMAAAFSGESLIYDATPVRTAVLAMGDSINRVFSGTGVYAATALALDNDRIQEVLSQVDFRLFGVQSREQLLNELKCAVPAEIVSAETTIAKFAWNAMALKDMAAGGMDEQKFLLELAATGAARPWNTIKAMAGKNGHSALREETALDEEDDEDGGGHGSRPSGIGSSSRRTRS